MPQVTAAQAQEALRSLLHQWTKAVETQDHAYFHRHMDDDWRYTDYTGALRGKPEYLQIIENVTRYDEDFQRFDVRIVGESVALITGVYVARVDFKGVGHLEKTLAFSAVWELRDGVWRALLHHTTEPIPAK